MYINAMWYLASVFLRGVGDSEAREEADGNGLAHDGTSIHKYFQRFRHVELEVHLDCGGRIAIRNLRVSPGRQTRMWPVQHTCRGMSQMWASRQQQRLSGARGCCGRRVTDAFSS